MNSAVISPCGAYRYHLSRAWPLEGAEGICLFVMLNPSTADADQDDPTIRRCIGFARRLRCHSLEVVNLFALRATDPVALLDHPDPVGPDNNEWIRDRVVHAKYVIAAWGTKGAFRYRDRRVYEMLPPQKSYCLGRTKDGHPKHPLYLPRGAGLESLYGGRIP